MIQGGDGFQARADLHDPDIIYSESQYAGVRRANLRTGETWGIKPPDPEGERMRWYWDTPLVVSRHVPGRLYFVANRLFQSDDRGDNWTPISPDLTRQLNRDEIPVMGRVWPDDAVWKHVFTSPLSTIVSFDESPLVSGLLYVGTDDGLIQVSEDNGRNTIGSRGSQGSGYYSASNPPYGATFSVYLGPDPTGEYALKIRDGGGKEIRHLSLRMRSGTQRITWDLREEAPEQTEAGQRQRRPRSGPEVSPGSFTATLVWQDPSGEIHELGVPRPFQVLPLELLR